MPLATTAEAAGKVADDFKARADKTEKETRALRYMEWFCRVEESFLLSYPNEDFVSNAGRIHMMKFVQAFNNHNTPAYVAKHIKDGDL